MKNKKIVAFMALFLLISSSVNGVSAFGEETTTATSTTEATSSTKEETSEGTTGETSSTEQVMQTSTSESKSATPTVESTTASPKEQDSTPQKSARILADTPAVVNDPTDLTLFQEKLLEKYPLGIATDFTVFAAGGLTFGTSGKNYDGTFGGKTINMETKWGGTYFQDAVPDNDDYPITYADTLSENNEEKIVNKKVTLLGESVLASNAANTIGVLDDSNNFHASGDKHRYYYLIENKLDGVNRLFDQVNATDTAEQATPVKLSNIADFKDNFGTLSATESYFDQAKLQLATVSNYYSNLTSKTVLVKNEAVTDEAKLVKKDGGWTGANSLRLDIPLSKDALDTTGTVVVNLDYNEYKNYYHHLTINIELPEGEDPQNYVTDSGEDSSVANKNLPFVIFNWENWKTFEWSDSYGAELTFTINGESADAVSENDGPFYQTMGSHILHNYPDIPSGTTASISGRSGSSNPFAGTILVPYGNINFPSSNSGTSFWGGLISGGDIRLDTTITKAKAFGSFFDSENLPDTTELLNGLKFTEKTVYANIGETPKATLKVTGPGKAYTIDFKLENLSDETMIKEWSQTFESILGGALPKNVGFPENLSLTKGKYQLTATINSWIDKTTGKEITSSPQIIADSMEIVVQDSGFLTLDAVPNLVFGEKYEEISSKDKVKILNSGELTKKAFGQRTEPDSYLKLSLTDSVISNYEKEAYDGNSKGLIRVTDTRPDGDYSLKVSLGSFKNMDDKKIITSDVPVVLELTIINNGGVSPYTNTIRVLGNNYQLGTNEGFNFFGENLTETSRKFAIKNPIELSNKEIEATVTDNSALYIGGSSLEAGTYQATLTWSLSNAPS
ncbi:WxL domain-containing protein [Enterococcus songbeiensis]|uniref:WxL domain-containing protein n=1 Tax=Enterococcus songbeiensis TaxID=2559927 RepID=UPI0010F71ADD|nr:WxL domain-containing protein [Enterococcus songbeiensis]